MNDEKQMVNKTFKLVFSETDIRRISINSSSWDSFITQLQKQYPSEFHPELRIQYIDTEGDKCTLSSKHEWDSMMDLFADQSTIKLYIAEGVHAGRYFKDGPPPQVQDMYVATGSEKTPLVKLDRADHSLAVNVPHCLKRLFPSGQILPYNLPSWMQPHVKVTKVTGSETDVFMDIDVSGLFDELHKQALKRIGPTKKPKALERAKAFLESMLEIVPNHPVTLYNLACAEALLGRGEAAIRTLKEAVAAGYNNVSHMISDADLASLQPHVEFRSLVEQMKSGFANVTAYSATTLRREEKKPEEAEQPSVQLEPVPTAPEAEPETEPYVVIDKPQEEEVKKEPEVKKVEEVVQVAAPVTTSELQIPEGFKWAGQLRVMVDMGFEVSRSIQALQKRKGNVDRAVNDLLLA